MFNRYLQEGELTELQYNLEILHEAGSTRCRHRKREGSGELAGLKDEDEQRQRRNISGLWFLEDQEHSTVTDYSSVYIRG